jgi:hypothetical protein
MTTRRARGTVRTVDPAATELSYLLHQALLSTSALINVEIIVSMAGVWQRP